MTLSPLTSINQSMVMIRSPEEKIGTPTSVGSALRLRRLKRRLLLQAVVVPQKQPPSNDECTLQRNNASSSVVSQTENKPNQQMRVNE
jgi:hypothetical protein